MSISSFRILIAICLFLYAVSAFSQDILKNGTPYVKQYDKSEYDAGNQNWGIAVGKNGIIYAANTEGLLSFDGQYWNLQSTNNKGILRSVTVDSKGKIYTGGKSDFGYWEEAAFGKLKYTQLSNLVDQKLLNDEEIWKIIEHKGKIYFHSFSKCYVYDGNKVAIIQGAGEPFLFPHAVGESIYIEKIPSGLHKLSSSNTLIPIKDKSKIKSNILTILPYEKGKYLIGTDKEGLFLLDSQGNIVPWANKAQELLKKAQINNGIVLYDQYFVFGTIQNGIIIINKQGALIQHINKNNGLQNNTVLSLAEDKQGNVWVGLDNGIDRIALNSPLHYYSDYTLDIGTVYASIVYNNKIYLGTNQGLFESNWDGLDQYNRLNFKLTPNSEGQVWHLKIMNNQLICSHNNGAFLVENNGLISLQNQVGGWQLKSADNDHNIFFQANYTGLSVYSYVNGWAFDKFYPNIQFPINKILHKEGLSYWAITKNGIQEITFDAQYKNVSSIKTFTAENNNVPLTPSIGVFRLKDEFVFTSDSGIYRFDNIMQKFVRYEVLNEKIGCYSRANKIVKSSEDAYYFINKSNIALITFDKAGDVVIDSTRLISLKGKMMNYYENIHPLSESVSLIGLDNGFALFDQSKSTPSVKLQAPLIRNVYNITAGMHAIAIDELKIPNKKGNIRFTYASPYYEFSPIQYQYYLKGHSEEWSAWDETAYNDFTNLAAGTYTFQVRSKNAEGQLSATTELTFEIEQPWFLKWPALLLYLILLILILRFAKKNYEKKIIQHQLKAKEAVLQEQKILQERQLQESEKRMMQLRNEQLEQELEIKNRELANTAMNIVYKNEMLNNLHKELTVLKDSDGKKLSTDQLRKINKLIDDAHNDDRDWDLFEKSFNEAHENFFKKLKADFPELVPNDLKLCAYLRLNMSSKEIASLLNITTRGVEIRRYRLRKKLNLSTEKNLTEFLLER